MKTLEQIKLAFLEGAESCAKHHKESRKGWNRLIMFGWFINIVATVYFVAISIHLSAWWPILFIVFTPVLSGWILKDCYVQRKHFSDEFLKIRQQNLDGAKEIDDMMK